MTGMGGTLMNRREEKRADRKQSQRFKRKKSRVNQALVHCGICGQGTKRIAAQAAYFGDDGSIIPYIVCPRCLKADLQGSDADRELAVIKAEFNLGISEPAGGVQ